MDIAAVLKELYQERDLLDQAILSLERAQVRDHRRRGRPPKWLTNLRGEVEAASAAPANPSTVRKKRKPAPQV